MQSGEILSADEENTDLLEHRSFVYVEIADLLKKKGLLTEAIDFKVRAFEFLEVYPKLSSSDTVAELACSLGTWLEEDNQITEGLAKLEKALEIYV